MFAAVEYQRLAERWTRNSRVVRRRPGTAGVCGCCWQRPSTRGPTPTSPNATGRHGPWPSRRWRPKYSGYTVQRSTRRYWSFLVSFCVFLWFAVIFASSRSSQVLARHDRGKGPSLAAHEFCAFGGLSPRLCVVPPLYDACTRNRINPHSFLPRTQRLSLSMLSTLRWRGRMPLRSISLSTQLATVHGECGWLSEVSIIPGT